MKIIAISAVTAGGKTTTVNELKKILPNAQSLHFDDYAFEGEVENFYQWVLDGADYHVWNLKPLEEDILKIKDSGKCDYLILDYPFAYCHNTIKDYIDKAFFIDTPLDVALARRILRDMKNATADEMRNDLELYLKYARIAFVQMHKDILPSSDYVIDGMLQTEAIVNEIIKAISPTDECPVIGLKRGIVDLREHNPEWEKIAGETINKLKIILGKTAIDIQHVGSTSVKSIKAKPIIDIAIAVSDFESILAKVPMLEQAGYIRRNYENENEIFFSCGNDKMDVRTHHIHAVLYNGDEWNNYLLFREYLNKNIEAAKRYETLKLSLIEKHKWDRIKYTDGKAGLIMELINEAKRKTKYMEE